MLLACARTCAGRAMTQAVDIAPKEPGRPFARGWPRTYEVGRCAAIHCGLVAVAAREWPHARQRTSWLASRGSPLCTSGVPLQEQCVQLARRIEHEFGRGCVRLCRAVLPCRGRQKPPTRRLVERTCLRCRPDEIWSGRLSTVLTRWSQDGLYFNQRACDDIVVHLWQRDGSASVCHEGGQAHVPYRR